MSQITISGFNYSYAQNGQWQYTTGVVELRLWYVGGPGQQFIDVDGNTVPYGSGNDFYKSVPCTVAGNSITIPAFSIPATDNSSNISSVARAQFYVNGSPADFLFQDWIITSTLGASISYNSLYTFNLAASLPFTLDPTYLTAPQVAALISSAVGALNFATTSLAGITRLSVQPVTASIPIAVGDNDPRLGSYINIITYTASPSGTAAANTTAINNAITAATAAGSGIYWPVGYFPVNSLTVSVPCIFAPGNSGPQPANGQTVTFTKAITADRSKHFDNALSTLGQGTISFPSTNTYVTEIMPEWWGAVTGTSASQSAAFQEALNNAAGRTVSVGTSTLASPWRIDTQLTFTNSGGSVPIKSFKMIGQGMLATVFDSRVANAPLLKIDANTGHVANTSLGFFYNTKLKGFQITTNSAAANGRGIDFSACWDIEIADVSVQGLASDAIRVNNLGTTDDSESSAFVHIHDCQLRLNGGYAINTNMSAGYIALGPATILRNYIAQNTTGGIRWIGSNTRFGNNAIYLNGDGVGSGFGLYLPYNTNGSTNITVDGNNEFESNSGGNIRIEGGDNFLIENNNFNTGNAGVGPNLPLNNVVIGDAVSTVCDRMVIQGNRFRSEGAATKGGIGIYLQPNARAPYVSGNGFSSTFNVNTITGTGAVAAGTTVTGTGTTFTSIVTPEGATFAVGWWINIGIEWRKVTVITDNTHVTVATPFTATLSGAAIRIAQNYDIFDQAQDTQTFDQRSSVVKQSTHWSSRTVSVAGVTTNLSLDDGVAQRVNFTAAGTQTIGAPLVSVNSGQTVYQFDLELLNNTTDALVVAFDSGWVVGADFVTPPSGLQTRAHFIFNPGAAGKWTQVGMWTPVVPAMASPTQLTASQNNYNPGPPSLYQRISSNAPVNITGLTFTATKKDGQAHYLVNVGSQNITLTNLDGASSAANQFQNSTGANIVLAGLQTAFCVYDLSSTKWRVFKLN